MQTDLAKDFLRSFTTEAESQHRLHLLYQAADELGLLERSKESTTWDYSNLGRFGDTLRIELTFFNSGLTSHFNFVEGAEYMSRFARELLPKIGEFRKEFDEATNRMKLVAKYKGIEIVLEASTPRACTVETIEEEVDVPEQVIPAHKEKKVRYALKGDCEPLMASPAAAEPVPEPELTQAAVASEVEAQRG